MEMQTLKLFGHTFIECFTISDNYRIHSEMRNDACLAYVQEGTQEIFSPTQKIIASDNESILMKCGNYVANFENVTPTSQFKSIVFHLNPESIKKAFGNNDISFLMAKKYSSIDPALKMAKNTLLDSFVTSIMPYFDNPDFINDRLLATKLQELVLILSDGGKNEIATYILGSLYSEEQLEFDRVIEANLYNNLSIEELAHLTNRSTSTFKRDFRKYFNESPAKYFKTKKLKKAAGLLLQTDLPVREIGWDCGFENPDHFSTSFTNHFGKPPREYRLNHN